MNKLLKGESIDYWGLRNPHIDELPETNNLSEQTGLRSFYIKPDGTKLYAVSETDDAIYQYSMDAWDIRTLSYDSKSYAVTTEETNPRGVWFKDDGTKMYVVGYGSDTFYQYSLSPAWDVSTANYDSVSLAAQDNFPSAIVFTPDGTGFYEVGDGNIIYQYTLGTAWDLSTASYASKSFDASTEITVFRGLAFSSDGTKMYANDQTNGIFQYSLSTAWDVSTASYDSKTYSTGLSGFGIFMRPNDEQIIAGDLSGSMLSFNLLTAKDIESVDQHPNKNTFIFTEDTISVFGSSKIPFEGVMSPDGTKFYVAYTESGTIIQINMSSPYDLTTASYNSYVDLSAQTDDIRGMDLSDDGTKLYAVDTNANIIYQYTLSTAFDITTATYDSKSLDITAQSSVCVSLRISSDGNNLYVGTNTGDSIWQYTLSTAYDLSTATYSGNVADFSTYIPNITAFALSPDGTKLILCYMNPAGLLLSVFAFSEWELTTAWDISTATYIREWQLPESLRFGGGGQTMDVSSRGDFLFFSPNFRANFLIKINL